MKDNFRDLTYEELHSKHDELNKKYMDLRFKSVLGHVENPLEKRTLRRNIARLKTLIHENDLGIRKG
ncbi:MAG: 50S ribosomal protein L29 [Spirochaetia bacterium]|jgi:large subunit ribosomal protein L29|nr:50S ribosomal protein L29 [Spirochaetia bacterium]